MKPRDSIQQTSSKRKMFIHYYKLMLCFVSAKLVESRQLWFSPHSILISFEFPLLVLKKKISWTVTADNSK